jgi:hypothetical protein
MDQKPTLLEWIFKTGLPLVALIAVGIGMTGYINFWLGVVITLLATVQVMTTLILISRSQQTFR